MRPGLEKLLARRLRLSRGKGNKESGERSGFLFGALIGYPYPRRIGLTCRQL